MKKIFATLMTVVIMLSSLTGCGSKGSVESSQVMDSSDQRKTLRVAMECTYSPYNWTQTESITDEGVEAVPL